MKMRSLSMVPAVIGSLLITAVNALGQQAAPPLSPPTGNVVTVRTVEELHDAVDHLTSGTTIMIEPGIYVLQDELRMDGVTNVAIRGATGNRNDVVLLGSGMNTPGVNICVKCENAQFVLIADLTIGDVFHHPIQVKGESGCDFVRIHNVRLFDAGEQFVKGTVDFENPNGVDWGIVQWSLIEYTVIGPNHGYTNGIDVHNGTGWIISNNVFRNIRVPPDAPFRLGPAVLMWSGSRDTWTVNNLFIDCERAIMYGLVPGRFPYDHQGGVIANNFVYRSADIEGDSGISVWDSPFTKVFHNTVLNSGTYPDAIEYRFPGSFGVQVLNNLTDANITQRDGGQATLAGNFTGAWPGMFVYAAVGDLRLLPTAIDAIDRGVNLPEITWDWDGDVRPLALGSDIGADEMNGAVGAAREPTPSPIDILVRAMWRF